MADSSNQPNDFTGRGVPSQESGGKTPIPRKVAMIDPGFRDPQMDSSVTPRIFGFKKPQNPEDRRNLKFLFLAVLVAVTIFGALEYKQIHDAGQEARKSVMDFFKHQ